MEEVEPFKISIEHYNQKHSTELNHSDVNINEVCFMFVGLLRNAGFNEDSILKCIDWDESKVNL